MIKNDFFYIFNHKIFMNQNTIDKSGIDHKTVPN